MPTRALVSTRWVLAAALVAAGLVAPVLLTAAPADAAARVSISNSKGTSQVDPKYATTIRVSGAGFQSIQGGHGGVYVFFGTVNGQWRPSKGGQTGRNLFYVPDSESKGNQGFQKFVAFPGSDTAGSANGGEIKADGTWSTSMIVPGATFNAVDRDGKAKKVDCLKTTCGIITIGAHGVKNSRNETFTPVSFKDLYGGEAPSSPSSAAAPTTTPDGEAATTDPPQSTKKTKKKSSAGPALTVDTTTAVAGRILTFNVVGLTPGDQIVASFDDGIAAVGPLNVGPNGQVAGAIKLPASTRAGTHTLKITGTQSAPSINFPVAAPTTPVSNDPADESAVPWLPIGFAIAALTLLLAAIAFSVVRIRSTRKTVAAHAI